MDKILHYYNEEIEKKNFELYLINWNILTYRCSNIDKMDFLKEFVLNKNINKVNGNIQKVDQFNKLSQKEKINIINKWIKSKESNRRLNCKIRKS